MTRISIISPSQKIQEKNELWRKVVKMKEFYFMMLIPLTLLIMFDYFPMYGVLIAFKDFKINKGIIGSDWNNFEYFKKFFNDVYFWRYITNTFRIASLRITICFIAPIVFSLMLNEIRQIKFKKIVQTISYLPHFLSWVVIAGFVYQLLSPEYGLVNYIVVKLGGQAKFFMGDAKMFVPILIISFLWHGIGWGSIVYLAAIAGIDSAMYESAEIDGANRLHCVWYITLPSIMPMITILFILSLRGVLSAGFDPIFNLSNDLVLETADVIETYSFRQGLYNAKYGYAAAIGLFQNLVGLCFLFSSNFVVKRINNQGIF